jgi:hypothetical protein
VRGGGRAARGGGGLGAVDALRQAVDGGADVLEHREDLPDALPPAQLSLPISRNRWLAVEDGGRSHRIAG